MNMSVKPAQKKAGLLHYVDHFFNKIFGMENNPVYQSGVLAVFLLMIVMVTGAYLVFFYRISSPYESVLSIQNQVFFGRWIRSLHRYASDLALVAIFFHALRMFLQRRTWGPRALAWISGVVLAGIILACGWMGLVLVWDRQAQVIATELSRLCDLFPFFAEPIVRAFENPSHLPRSFFFLILFMHVSVPVGLIFIFWLHTSRVARPSITPPKPVMKVCLVALLALSILWPVGLDKTADTLVIPGRLVIDWFYSFWIPVSLHYSPGVHLLFWILLTCAFVSVPFWLKAAPDVPRHPSFVHEKSCTGCTSCAKDCPYEAIQMIPRSIGFGSELVAHVTPERCVSCGICAAACDPMGVGPPGRTGKEQIKGIEELFSEKQLGLGDVVVVGCSQGFLFDEPAGIVSSAKKILVPCSGGFHQANVDFMLKKGIKGVFIVTCPPRNCTSREGPQRLSERLFEGRESSLRHHVDKRRLQVSAYSPLDSGQFESDLIAFKKHLDSLDQPKDEAPVLPEPECAHEKNV